MSAGRIFTAKAAVARPSIKIAGRQVGGGAPGYLIAEVAQAHDGSLGLAHCFIDAAKEAGADAVKFQTHFADEESTLDEEFRVKFSRQDESRFAYWKRMEFTEEQWAGLVAHAREISIGFLSSAFSHRAVDLLERLDSPAWKIASGELSFDALLDRMAATGKPVLMSTGMSGYAEIEATIGKLRRSGAPVAVLQCTSRYPTKLEEVGLNVIGELRERYTCPAGLSDHSGTVYPAMLALAKGADIVEAHITLNRRMFGPDVSSSLTVEEFAQVSAARDAFATMEQHPVDKDAMALSLADMRKLFQRSVAVVCPMPEGTVLRRDMLTVKKPAKGIPASDIDSLVGKRLKRSASPDRILHWEDVHDE
jgi:N,N'-diacetyllegionaminate synthase